MAAPTVKDVLDRSAALCNDAGMQLYTYVAQLPYYNSAQDELSEIMEQENVPYSNATSLVLANIPAGTILLDFTTTPALPADLTEIQKLSERLSGTSNDFYEMTRKEFLPQTQQQISSLVYWVWENQQLKFIGSNTPVDVLLNYVSNRLPTVTSTATVVNLINARSFLQYRTAALAAYYIGENESRAVALNADATRSLDRFLGISAKGRQAITTRRKPFMAAYRARGTN